MFKNISFLLFLTLIQLKAYAGLDLSPTTIEMAAKSVMHTSSEDKRPGKIFNIKIAYQSELSNDWAKKLCQSSALAISHSYGVRSHSNCFYSLKNQDILNSVEADFELNLKYELDGNMRISLINLNQKDPNVTNKTGWKIKFDTLENFQLDLEEKLTGSYFVMNNLDIIRDVLVDFALKAENRLPPENSNIDRNKIYQQLKKDKIWNSQIRKFILIGSEFLTFYASGRYIYYNLADNTPDWDYREGVIHNIENKLTLGSMFRYDDNQWYVNEAHVFAGVTYYLQCRGLGLSAFDSYLCSFAGSVAWENLIEWREVFSINDQIFTSTGGAILAEAIHQLGKFIDQKSPSWFRNSIGWAYRGPKFIFNGLDQLMGGTPGELDSENPLVEGKFEMSIMMLATSEGVTQKRVELNNEVTIIPLRLEDGHEVKFINNIVQTQLKASGPTEDFMKQFDVFAKLVMAAYYEKNIGHDQKNALTGHSLFIGPSAALELNNDFELKNDFMGIVHFFGATAEVVNFYKGYKITSTLDFWADSVMMKSMIVEKYKQDNPQSLIVGNLANSEYFHGFGYTSQGQIIVEFGNWNFGGNFRSNNEYNTNYRQRDLGRILDELNIHGVNFDSELFVERKITKNLKIKFLIQHNERNEDLMSEESFHRIVDARGISLQYFF